jgi:hypothetical protein
LSRTNGVVLTAPPDGALGSSRFLIGARPVPISESVFVFGSSFFGPSFCIVCGSTAKRDQSFICTYPALREGLYGRLSLGNPPALKQSVQVYREASLRRTGRLRQGPAGTRVSRIETVTPSSRSSSAAAQNPFDRLTGQLVWLPTRRHPSDERIRPFMIGICQGQTELSLPLLPTEPLVAHAS